MAMELLLRHANIHLTASHEIPSKNMLASNSKMSSFICRVDKLGQTEQPPNWVLWSLLLSKTKKTGEQTTSRVVSGTCRNSVKKKKQFEENGFDVHLFDANDPQLEILNNLRSCTHLLVSIPPVKGVGDPMMRHYDLLRSTLSGGSLQWLCYLSSTGVYGHCDGALVDEDYTPNPITEMATLRLGAEEKWLKLADNLGICGQVFRLGGIYGPCRSAVDMLIKQEPLSVGQKMRESRQYTSGLHVDDICQALNASICRSPSRKIYNIVDDDPAPGQEVFAYAQDLIEKKWNVRLTHGPFPQREEPLEQKRVIKGREASFKCTYEEGTGSKASTSKF